MKDYYARLKTLWLGRSHARQSIQHQWTSLLTQAAHVIKEALYKVYLEDKIQLSIKRLMLR
jgi:hypothetical protein